MYSSKENFKKTISKYDKEGRLVEITSLDTLNNITSLRNVFFDENGNKIQEIAKRGDEVIRKAINKYDENGNCLERYTYKVATGSTKFTRDEVGKVTELLTTFKLDKYGNQIEQMNYRNGELNTISNQIIEYF